jgi:hypothetical protein
VERVDGEGGEWSGGSDADVREEKFGGFRRMREVYAKTEDIDREFSIFFWGFVLFWPGSRI